MNQSEEVADVLGDEEDPDEEELDDAENTSTDCRVPLLQTLEENSTVNLRNRGNLKGYMTTKNSSPTFLSILEEGFRIPLNDSIPLNSRPEWMDSKKLKKGREFALGHIFALVYSEMLSLAILLSLRGSLEALIFTGKSSTPYTSYRRYLSTVLRVCSWYSSDPWEEGSEAQRNLSEVRKMHVSVSKQLNSTPRSELSSKVTLEGQKLWCSSVEDIKKDLEESGIKSLPRSCPFAAASSLRYERASVEIYVNQTDLSLTQFGFMGLVTLYPRSFGLGNTKDEDLEAFIHLWRALGYSLGIEDRYNFCSGDLEETRKRCRDLIDKWVKPNLLEVTDEWEHMYRCIVEGISYYVPANSFHAAMEYLCEVLEIPTPRLYSLMRWWERLLLFAHRLVLRFFLRIPGMFWYYNRSVMIALNKAREASPEYLRKLKEKRYRYMSES